MERVSFNYSLKNIPIPPVNAYKKRLVEKVESVVKRMRWKAFYFLKEENYDDDLPKEEKFGFKTRRCPPQISDMIPFEDDMLKMIEGITFRKSNDNFQKLLSADIKRIKQSDKMFVPADKTQNYYQVSKDQYEKLLKENITKTYKKASPNTYDEINMDAKRISSDLDLDDRMETMAKREAFITLKDHKDNFANNTTCRLINPTKSEMGRVSKKILDRINSKVRSSTGVNQWKNTASVIDWFTKLPNKSDCTFILFDIVNFYPSITEAILHDALIFAKQFTDISDQDIDIILHARKSLLFNDSIPWVKRDNKNLFDVTMGSYDGAEVCELVGAYVLSIITTHYSKDHVGLYRDDGLAIFHKISGNKAEKIKKHIAKIFKDLGLKITIEANLKVVDYLDITLDLNSGKYYPYRKPNDNPVYINSRSNHPPVIIKHLPAAINRRLCDISYDKYVFQKAAPLYADALKTSGYNEELVYKDRTDTTDTTKKRRNRQRNIIWFNPPFNHNVSTNVGRIFLKLLERHFPKEHKLHKIFNKGNVKVSYSCMGNMGSIIKAHNNKILNNKNDLIKRETCNCQDKPICPLNGKCQSNNIVYRAQVKVNNGDGKSYIGSTENSFKTRYNNHKCSFNNLKYGKRTELSKYIWKTKESGHQYSIDWDIIAHADAYSNTTKRCNLCLTEKMLIISSSKFNLLNKRSELISKCRHENKFMLSSIHVASPRALSSISDSTVSSNSCSSLNSVT